MNQMCSYLLAMGIFTGALHTAAAAPRGPVRAAPPPSTELFATVEGLLRGYEPGDPGEVLARLGAPAAEVLLKLATEGKARPMERLRAIEALQHVPTAAGREFLRDLLATRRGQKDSLAVYEIAAAARALSGHGALAVPELVPLLGHDSADVREGAAYALGRLRTSEALTALSARLRIERDSGVRGELSRALRRSDATYDP